MVVKTEYSNMFSIDRIFEVTKAVSQEYDELTPLEAIQVVTTAVQRIGRDITYIEGRSYLDVLNAVLLRDIEDTIENEGMREMVYANDLLLKDGRAEKLVDERFKEEIARLEKLSQE